MAYSWLALSLLAASLYLPSFEFVFMKTAGLMPGWAAAWYSLGAVVEGISRMAEGQGDSMKGYCRYFTAGGAALANLIFLVAPFILRKRIVARRSLIVLSVLVPAGLALGLASSLCFADMVERFLIGYYVWLCAYVALAAAILAAWLEDRAAGTAQ